MLNAWIIVHFTIKITIAFKSEHNVCNSRMQAAQHQYIQQKYDQSVPLCSDIMTAASIAEKSNLPAQAQQWREEFLKHRCALQFPDLLINAAQIHVELASAFAQKGDLESAKEHLGTFFQLWSTADEHVPLYQKAQKLSDSLGL